MIFLVVDRWICAVSACPTARFVQMEQLIRGFAVNSLSNKKITIHKNSHFIIKKLFCKPKTSRKRKFTIIIRVKYILAPQTTTLFPDGTPNYQCLDYGPPNYHFLIFWPHPFIYAVNSNRNWSKTRKYPSLNRGNFKVYKGYFRISV
jgi:hypothetical protein